MQPNIILASTSKYRASLLTQLGLPFSLVDPDIEEPIKERESPPDRATRLAREKAVAGALTSVHSKEQGSVIIGSDQVAHLGQTVFSKPGNFENARVQLRASSDQWVTFSVGVCLCNQTGDVIAAGLDQYAIRFRDLSDQQIERYLNHDRPYDCAGSIKAESLGVALFTETRGKDINTLYGLPLILLTDLLAEVGISVI